jgi:hypothetical protein
MPQLARRLRLALVPAALVLAGLGADDRAVEAAIQQLKDALTVHRAGPGLPRLASLRQLRDQSLRPLFFELARHEDARVRVHAILGLGEIDPARRIDTWLLRQIDVPEAQFAAAAHALVDGLLDTEGIRELEVGEGVEPGTRALLLAALAARGETVDLDTARSLAEAEDLITAGLAACVLAEAGDAKALARHRTSVDALDPPARRAHLLELFAISRELALTSVCDLVTAVIQGPDADPEVQHAGVQTVLAVDPSRGTTLWSQMLGDEASYGRRVRFGLTLLEASPQVPARTFDHLPGDEPLLVRIRAAGQALSGGGAATALADLVDLGHPFSARAALTAAEGIAPSQSRRLYAHVIDAAAQDRAEGRDTQMALAVTATKHLFEIDPDAVQSRLDEAKGNTALQEAILLGLLDTQNPKAGEAARSLKRLGFSRVDSLSLLLIAKHTERLDPDELHELGVIAGGGGRLSEALKTQAAWLYLKHADRIEQAITATLAKPS